MARLRYSPFTVLGRLSIAKAAVAAAMLVGGAAWAQQGLIVEPWKKPVPSSQPSAVQLRVMPGSGLPAPGPLTTPSLPPPRASRPSPSPPTKWSPPVVALLVDPWDRSANAAPAARPRWLPLPAEIVDPWPKATVAQAPQGARPPAEAPARSTIF